MLALPEEFRLAVYYADIEGFRYREIAEIMQTAGGTVARDYIADDAGCANCWRLRRHGRMRLGRSPSAWVGVAGGFSALRCCGPRQPANAFAVALCRQSRRRLVTAPSIAADQNR